MCLKLQLEQRAAAQGLRLTTFKLAPAVRRYALSLDWERVGFRDAVRSARWFTTLREVKAALT